MGLDMYLNRIPRFENCTAKDVDAIEGYFDWKERKAEGSSYAQCTLKEWCGVSYDELNKRAINFYKPFYTVKYYAWDTEHKYPHKYIHEQVGCWRKANAIHKWFVDNVQDGVDDCGYYEVSREQLEELLNICKIVVGASPMAEGWIKNGERYANGMWCPIFEEGEYVADIEKAKELLPTQGGFFFGSTDYDQWYMEDIKDTIEILTKVLEETDFDTQMIAYSSSW